MVINTGSWHYKAWRWTYSEPWRAPSITNFCSYMRRLMFLVPGKAMWTALTTILYSIFVLCPVVVFSWMVGYKTVSVDVGEDAVEYQGLHVAGKTVYPWHVILPALIVGMEVLLVKTSWFTFGLVSGTILGSAALLLVVAVLCTSDSVHVFRDWFRAKKRKICPLIEFGDHYDAEQVHDEETV